MGWIPRCSSKHTYTPECQPDRQFTGSLCWIRDMHPLQGCKVNIGTVVSIASTRKGQLIDLWAEGRWIGNIGWIPYIAPLWSPWLPSSAVGAYPSPYMLCAAGDNDQLSAGDDCHTLAGFTHSKGVVDLDFGVLLLMPPCGPRWHLGIEEAHPPTLKVSARFHACNINTYSASSSCCFIYSYNWTRGEGKRLSCT